jgi:hypothetical protein
LLLVPISEMNRVRGLPPDPTDDLMVRSTSRNQEAINGLSTRIDNALAAARMQEVVSTSKEQGDRVTGQMSIVNRLLHAVALIVALVGAI